METINVIYKVISWKNIASLTSFVRHGYARVFVQQLHF